MSDVCNRCGRVRAAVEADSDTGAECGAHFAVCIEDGRVQDCKRREERDLRAQLATVTLNLTRARNAERERVDCGAREDAPCRVSPPCSWHEHQRADAESARAEKAEKERDEARAAIIAAAQYDSGASLPDAIRALDAVARSNRAEEQGALARHAGIARVDNPFSAVAAATDPWSRWLEIHSERDAWDWGWVTAFVDHPIVSDTGVSLSTEQYNALRAERDAERTARVQAQAEAAAMREALLAFPVKHAHGCYRPAATPEEGRGPVLRDECHPACVERARKEALATDSGRPFLALLDAARAWVAAGRSCLFTNGDPCGACIGCRLRAAVAALDGGVQ